MPMKIYVVNYMPGCDTRYGLDSVETYGFYSLAAARQYIIARVSSDLNTDYTDSDMEEISSVLISLEGDGFVVPEFTVNEVTLFDTVSSTEVAENGVANFAELANYIESKRK